MTWQYFCCPGEDDNAVYGDDRASFHNVSTCCVSTVWSGPDPIIPHLTYRLLFTWRGFEKLLLWLLLSFFNLQQTRPCDGSYLTIAVGSGWSCFSFAQFMIALIVRRCRLMARIFQRTNTCCAASPPARRPRPNSPCWHDEFDKSSYRPGRQLKSMWQGSLSPLSSCSASFRSHLSPLWISYF